jgi:DNA-binding XRE family transcriptional regulator
MSTSPDFLDELIEESTAENLEFPQLIEAAQRSRALVRSLARAREQAGITQAELAQRMGTTQSAIARLEGAERDPRLSTVIRYAQIVGRTLLAVDADVPG